MVEPTPTSAANYQRVQEGLLDLMSWTSIGVIVDALADIAQHQSCTEGKALYDLGSALYAVRVASGLPGYYSLPPHGDDERAV